MWKLAIESFGLYLCMSHLNFDAFLYISFSLSTSLYIVKLNDREELLGIEKWNHTLFGYKHLGSPLLTDINSLRPNDANMRH